MIADAESNLEVMGVGMLLRGGARPEALGINAKDFINTAHDLYYLRSGDLRRRQRDGSADLPVTTSSYSLYAGLAITADGVIYSSDGNTTIWRVLANGTNADIVATNSGYALIPKTPEVYVYDVDGNLRTNGLWVLTWDGENRLASADSASAVPASAKQSLRFAYDSRSRRISKVVSNWTGNTWSLSYCTKFIYDGWNLLAEVNATNNAVIRSYIWGIDLSGAPQRAGGVGGLLAMRDSSGSTATNYFYEYDGNFNVRGLIDNPSGISWSMRVAARQPPNISTGHSQSWCRAAAAPRTLITSASPRNGESLKRAGAITDTEN